MRMSCCINSTEKRSTQYLVVCVDLFGCGHFEHVLIGLPVENGEDMRYSVFFVFKESNRYNAGTGVCADYAGEQGAVQSGHMSLPDGLAVRYIFS